MNYKININDFEAIKLTEQTLNEKDIIQLSPKSYHVVDSNKSYNFEIVSFDKNSKELVISLDGNNYHVAILSEVDQMIESMGYSTLDEKKINNIKAPMPGLILSVNVKEGDTVSKGDTLLVLEAMKMENVLKAPADGTIKAIPVNVSDAVEKNQLLIELD